MASMAQPFAQHPPGMVHGGHPMIPGHPSGQGMPGGGQQPGVSMGQHMAAGVVGPGGPQVTQAGPMMAGMMPGAGPPGVSGGPSAHAQAHLTPSHQGPMFHNQQQQQQQIQHMSKLIYVSFCVLLLHIHCTFKAFHIRHCLYPVKARGQVRKDLVSLLHIFKSVCFTAFRFMTDPVS